MLELWDGTKKKSTSLNYAYRPTQNQHKVVSEPWATQTHKTHHGSDLGEATTFPLIVYSATLHEGHIQMAFCPKTPKWSPKIPTTQIPATLEVHNFACRPSIVMRFKAQV